MPESENKTFQFSTY